MIIKGKSDFELAMESIAGTFFFRGGQLFALLLGIAIVFMGGNMIYSLFALDLPLSTNVVITFIGILFIFGGIFITVKWKTILVS